VLQLVNLDERVRQLMLDELRMDMRNGTLYVSPRLSNTGQQNYAILLEEAIRNHNDEWLAEQFRHLGRLRPTESRRKQKGGYTTARVPVNAAEIIAEGEFNRFYARGLCRLAGEEGIRNLIVYRAKLTAHPRELSSQLEGAKINAQKLLKDLRANPGMETKLHVPAGHGSGLSVRLPVRRAAVSLRENTEPLRMTAQASRPPLLGLDRPSVANPSQGASS
jgi:hypothetical protein